MNAIAPKTLIVDFDDWNDANAANTRDMLFQLHREIPGFKVTLFAIGSQCDPIVLRELASTGWIEFAAHGWTHSYLECSHWNRSFTEEHLARYEGIGCFAKVFKAPYWETSPGLYEGLIRRGWMLADHPRNDDVRPKELEPRTYKLGTPGCVHGHVQNVCGNGLQEKFEYYRSLRADRFLFVSEAIEEMSAQPCH